MSSSTPDGVTWKARMLYGLGYLSVALTTDMTLTWLLKRYRPDPADPRWTVLTTAGAFAAAMVLGRVVDAIADPLVGFYSDRIQTRWGRRKPFIFAGAPVLALSFILLWTPPFPEASVLNGIYLAVIGALFFLSFTVVVCPYLAMLPEITDDTSERVRLTAWQAGFNVIGAVGGMLLAGYLIDHHGYRTMALVFAPMVLMCSWAPLAVETPEKGNRPCDMPLLAAISATLRNPLFIPYVISQLLFWMALRIVMGVLPKIVEIRAGVTETAQGAVMAVGLLVGALFFPLMPAAARRFGKKHMLMAAMVYFGALMVPFIYLGALPVPVSALIQAGIVMALAGPAVATLFTLPNAMVADIVDNDAVLTGRRREAIYFGVQGLIVKSGLGLGIGMAALLLNYFGETASEQGGFTACGIAALVLSWIAAAVLSRYEAD